MRRAVTLGSVWARFADVNLETGASHGLPSQISLVEWRNLRLIAKRFLALQSYAPIPSSNDPAAKGKQRFSRT